MNKKVLLLGGLALSLSAITLAAVPKPPKADPQMQAVLDQLKALGGKPIEKLTPDAAREQPTPTDAVVALLKKRGMSAAPEAVAKIDKIGIPGPAGNTIYARVYTPGGSGPFPVVVYIHGGGWVIADLDVYDASPRAIANAAQAIVVSIEYRHAPENRFPAAHEDSYAATQWVMKNAQKWNGDPKRVAIVGESAGGNMAAAVCLMARDRGGMMPIYQGLVYPVAQIGMMTESYRENYDAKPLNSPMMFWFAKYTLEKKADGQDKRINLLKADLKGMPPVTIVAAQIDPLRTEGKMLADRFKAAGVPVRYQLYNGVTHEFFGMAAVVDKAKMAQVYLADGLKTAFNK